MSETYLSIDIEADGPVPGFNNMLSFGVAAFNLQADDPREPIATFARNLKTLDEVTWPLNHASPDTMKWWGTQPEAWAACRKGAQAPGSAMRDFVRWCRQLPGKLIVVGYPVTFDFMFLYWYVMVYGVVVDGDRCPFGFSGMDIKTLAAAKLGKPFHRATKRNMPKRWFKGAPKHNHEALTDAIGQGILFINMVLDDPA
jgi:hypothetical protein